MSTLLKKPKKKLYHLIKNQDLSDVLVFSRTKHGADNVKALQKTGLQLTRHGDISECKMKAERLLRIKKLAFS
jgi:superfamily II DNA/RNA helicase